MSHIFSDTGIILNIRAIQNLCPMNLCEPATSKPKNILPLLETFMLPRSPQNVSPDNIQHIPPQNVLPNPFTAVLSQKLPFQRLFELSSEFLTAAHLNTPTPSNSIPLKRKFPRANPFNCPPPFRPRKCPFRFRLRRGCN